ncbi:hypothetical protein GC207_14720 [bacterium]|nr:hypothetical protein [bacterium]
MKRATFRELPVSTDVMEPKKDIGVLLASLFSSLRGSVTITPVARKNPMPRREAEICKRFSEFRRGTKIPRSTMAAELGIKASRLSNYEHAAVPVPYSIASKFANITGMNLAWLVEGQGDPHDRIGIGPEIGAKIAPRALVSEAFDQHIKPALLASVEEGPTLIEQVLAREKGVPFTATPIRTIGMVTGANFARSVAQIIKGQLGDLPAHLYLPLARKIGVAVAEFKAANGEVVEKELASELQNVTVKNVKSEWETLRSRLNKVIARTSSISALASHLKVPRPSLSLWLSGKREPGVEVGFRLLRWCELQEKRTK